MAIIANGIEIPTNNDFMNANSTNIEKVIANGVTVWEKIIAPIEPRIIWDGYSLYPGTTIENFTIRDDISNNDDIHYSGKALVAPPVFTELDAGINVATKYCYVNVDVTGYKNIAFTINGMGVSAKSFGASVGRNIDGSNWVNFIYATYGGVSIVQFRSFTLDVAELSGIHRIGLKINCESSGDNDSEIRLAVQRIYLFNDKRPSYSELGGL